MSYLHLSTLVLALAVVLVVISRLSLDIEKKLCIGALRCFVQLSALGLILVPILTYNSPPLVIAYIIFMMFVASVESASRVPYVFDSLLLVCFISIAAAATIFGAFTFYVVLGTRLDAQYAIPIIGMIMGMSLTAVSVTVASIVTHIAERKESVEILLVLGATRWEAARHAVKSSIVLGLTPLLNSMSVSGLVSIPGTFAIRHLSPSCKELTFVSQRYSNVKCRSVHFLNGPPTRYANTVMFHTTRRHSFSTGMMTGQVSKHTDLQKLIAFDRTNPDHCIKHRINRPNVLKTAGSSKTTCR